MCMRRMRLGSPFRGAWNIAMSMILLAALGALPAEAQTGVIAFKDQCTGLVYAMRGDGTGRIALPLPPLPQPTNEHEYWDSNVLDVSTSGPLTVVYYVAIAHRDPVTNDITVVDVGLFAAQLDDVGGRLVPAPGSPVRLTLPADVGFGVNPNMAQIGAFSRVSSGDRLALVTHGLATSVLMTARVDRDVGTSRITGLSDLVVLGDLYSLASLPPPDPNVPAWGVAGIDYTPDGSSIVVSIRADLWMVRLLPDNTFGGIDPVTPINDGFAQWNPSYSRDGARIAYTAGAMVSGPVAGSVRSGDIYALTLSTGAVARVTSQRNKDGATSGRDSPMWSPDGRSIGFWAYPSGRTPRRSPCSGLVNTEIFLINADDTGTAFQITNTNGTSVEAWPKWGW